MAESMNTTYCVPDTVKDVIKEHIAYMVKVLPGWCEQLTIHFSSDPPEKGCQAQIETSYRYRNCNLIIYPAFLESDTNERKKTIVHEAAHSLNAPIAEFVEHTIKAAFGTDSKTSRIVQANWEIANEAAICDITTALFAEAGIEESAEGDEKA